MAIVFVLGLHLAVRKSDELSAQRQSREIAQAVSNGLDDLAQAQEGAAVWDLLAWELAKPMPDWAWVDENVGQWLHGLFRHDALYILDGADRLVYGSANGQALPPGEHADILQDIGQFVDLVRGRRTRQNNPHERLPGQPLAADNSLRTTPAAVHATDVAIFRGRPAAVSVMRIEAPLHGAASDDRAPLLVNVRYLDGSFLRDLSRNNQIEALHFHRFATGQAHDGEYATELVSSEGKRLGYLMWLPDLPGSELWQALLPLLAATLAGLGGIIVLLSTRTYRLMGQQARNLEQLRSAHVELRAREAQAHHLAFHDVLTGLPNRALFNNCVDQALGRTRTGDSFAILLLDLDRFKHVNDTWGHLAGDALIQEFASRLSGAVSTQDTVARLGGDEFAILAKGRTPQSIAVLADAILAQVRRPFEVLGNRAFVGLSIGISFAPQNGTDRAELMRKADIALYRAKDEGRDRYCVFSAEMDETVKVRAAIEEDLRRALASPGELQVFYQPQIDSQTHALIGVEALARWNHPVRGPISPQLFVPIAEDTGLINPLGQWVLAQACRAALKWPGLSVAVNLSPVQFQSGGFAEAVTSQVLAAGVHPSRIELEVTEGVLVDDDQRVRTALNTLRKNGFRIALDDFGTGYSSLSYLRKFEVDKIKIDRSFIQSIGQAADSTPIVSAVVTLGHAMGLTVTAEGVETPEQRDFLATAGCNEFQGFLFSKAVSEDEISRLLERADPGWQAQPPA
ncbi:EAL domain-containing protein [Orrella sp. JC864]|uniref:putative bifunctional diguanylate cyclase/phosphodiesterase n=1 Tax=Orrella sp. JC864 TaxID=3120298 RepID=UPI0030087258